MRKPVFAGRTTDLVSTQISKNAPQILGRYKQNKAGTPERGCPPSGQTEIRLWYFCGQTKNHRQFGSDFSEIGGPEEDRTPEPFGCEPNALPLGMVLCHHVVSLKYYYVTVKMRKMTSNLKYIIYLLHYIVLPYSRVHIQQCILLSFRLDLYLVQDYRCNQY